jgi:hypothetical protein
MFAGKCMELRTIILNEISQTQKQVSCFLSVAEYRPNAQYTLIWYILVFICIHTSICVYICISDRNVIGACWGEPMRGGGGNLKLIRVHMIELYYIYAWK